MSDTEKTAGASKDVDYVRGEDQISEIQTEVNEVQRNLKARHISMIALGGTIATGLFISTKIPISAGPVIGLVAYLFITTLAYSITQSLGEMATYLPCSGSFIQFATRFGSPALGCANGWMYWFSWAITFSLEISVVGQIVQYWTNAVPLAAWISIFWVVITCANMVPVKLYGEIEFWISSIKVIAVVGWLIYAFCMVCGAGKTGPVGFRYWRNPGPWGDGGLFSEYVDNIHTSRFLNWLNSLISALFTFQGVELVGISCGLLVPYNDPKLTSDSSFAASSPFIIAIQNSGTPVLADIFNAVILLAIISAANSNVYCASRILYGLAQSGVAPKIFLKVTKQGIPYISVLFTATLGSLGYMVLSNDGNTVFEWLLNITAVASLITWVNISFSHIRFMNVLKSRNISRETLPFKAAWMPWSAYYAFVLCFMLVFVQGFSCFYGLTASSFFTSYISVILWIVIWIVAHFYYSGKDAFKLKSLLVPLDDIDIDTGVREIDEAVWDEEVPTTFFGKLWGLLS